MRPAMWVWHLLAVSAAIASPAAAEFLCAGQAGAPAPSGAAAKLAAAGPAGQAPSRRVHALVVYARFSDEGAAPVPGHARSLFDPELPGSLTHYYATMSGGQLDLGGTVLPGRYASQEPAASYVASDQRTSGGYGQFVMDVLHQVDRDVDFGEYDDDGPDGRPNSGDDDGYVDYVFVNVLSTPRGFIEGGATGIAGLGFQAYLGNTDASYLQSIRTDDVAPDGTPIRISSRTQHGAVEQEGSFAQTVGSMAHEFGHGLGLPDLYDLAYGDPADDSAGVGAWDLMGWGAHGWHGDDGPAVLSAWCLARLGWIGAANARLLTVTGDTTGLRLGDPSAGGIVCRIPLGSARPLGELYREEYLLLERRTRTYYNRGIPAEGLLVWHVRPLAGTNGDETAKRVDLVCADGLFDDAGFPAGRSPALLQGRDNLDFWAHDEQYSLAHGGNQGDATDPFDGVRYRRLSLRTNPSTAMDVPVSSAFEGLSLTMRPQGAAMLVDIVQPRWAGVIVDSVHWGGRIHVDGDLRVAAGGTLVLHDSTTVEMAGADRLAAGQDAGHIEVEVQGSLAIAPRAAPGSVVFRASDPSAPWDGIALRPAATSFVSLPAGTYLVRDALRGIVLPDAPPGGQGRVVRSYHIVDAATGATAGNGDGLLNPGESFQVVAEVANWSLANLEGASPRLSWDSPLVARTWQSGTAPQSLITGPQRVTLGPGRTSVVGLPGLTLAPEARPGQSVGLVVEWSGDGLSKRDTLSLPVVDGRPVEPVSFDAPREHIVDQSVLLQVGRPVTFRAMPPSGVGAVSLVVRSIDSPDVATEVPLRPHLGASARTIYVGRFTPSAPGPYVAFLRSRGERGTAAFSTRRLYLWVDASTPPAPILVLFGSQYSAASRVRTAAVLERLLDERGLAVRVVDEAPDQGALYRAVLPHYAAPGHTVIWLGRTLDQDAQAAFEAFVQRGGRLLIASLDLPTSVDADAFLAEVVHARVATVRRGGSYRRPIRSLYLDLPLQFRAAHVPLEVLPPAQAILLNSQDLAAGLHLDTDRYRLAYLPFDLSGLTDGELGALLPASIAFLQGSAPPARPAAMATGAAHSALTSYPNPFNAATALAYELGQRQLVELSIYNIAGQRVRRLVHRVQEPGAQRTVWDGRDDDGRPVASGVYLGHLRTPTQQQVRRLLLLK